MNNKINQKTISIMTSITIMTLFSILFIFTGVGTISAETQNDIIFSEDYSSANEWSQKGNAHVTNGVAKLDRVNGLGSYTNDTHRVIKELEQVLPESWILETEYILQQDSMGTSIVVALSNSTDVIDPHDVWQSVGIYESYQDTSLALASNQPDTAKRIPISLNTKYYLTLEKTPENTMLSIFSDSERTQHIAKSPTMLDVSKYLHNDDLVFIQHGILAEAGGARVTTSEIDNTVIFTQNTGLSCGDGTIIDESINQCVIDPEAVSDYEQQITTLESLLDECNSLVEQIDELIHTFWFRPSLG